MKIRVLCNASEISRNIMHKLGLLMMHAAKNMPFGI